MSRQLRPRTSTSWSWFWGSWPPPPVTPPPCPSESGPRTRDRRRCGREPFGREGASRWEGLTTGRGGVRVPWRTQAGSGRNRNPGVYWHCEKIFKYFYFGKIGIA